MISDFEELKRGILNCRDCMQKFGFTPHPIFYGSSNAKVFQISQAPSKKVYYTGKPFTDATGKKLREWYQVSEEVFYNPNLFYITAIAHCFPGKGKNGGDVRPPKECAKRWLLKELDCVQNEIYLIVGKEAANFLFPGKNYTDLIFQDQVLNKKTAFVLPHPSPVNIKWFKDHPEFLSKRLLKVRKAIHKVLG